MKFLRIAAFALCSLLAFGSAEAQHHGSRPNYGAVNIASPTEDITKDNKILITRVGTTRTQKRATSMVVTSLDSPVDSCQTVWV